MTQTAPAPATARHRPGDPLGDPVFAERYRAMRARDARFDGQFITGVHSTGIYCRPSCPAVSPKPTNVSFYLTAAAAHEAGLRACKRCLPDAVPGSPEWDLRDDLAARAMRLIADGVVEREGVPGLAARLGYTTRHLTRVVTAELGAGPLASRTGAPRADGAGAADEHGDARGRRRVRVGLRQRAPVQRDDPRGLRPQSARAAGRGSRARAGGAPTPCRRDRTGSRAPAASRSTPVRRCGCVRVARGASGGRRRGRRRRSLPAHAAPAGRAGPRRVRRGRRCRLPRDRRRRPARDPRRPAAARRPGATPVRPRRRCGRHRRGARRRPRARAVGRGRTGNPGAGLPRPARTRVPRAHRAAGLGEGRAHGALAPRRRARRAGRHRSARCRPASTGSPAPRNRRSTAIPAEVPYLLFPTAAAIADHGAEVLRGPAARVRTIVDVARRLDSGELVVAPEREREDLRLDLLEVPGIGPWTAGYVSMRVTRAPDVLLTGDLALRNGAERPRAARHGRRARRASARAGLPGAAMRRCTSGAPHR